MAAAPAVVGISFLRSLLHLGSVASDEVEGLVGFVFCHFSGAVDLLFLGMGVVVSGGAADVQ